MKGMAETAYYARFEAGFESYPAENYVDYMTNVMPVPERHFFYIPQRKVAIVCEARKSEADRELTWGLRKYTSIPPNSLEIRLNSLKVEEIFAFLSDMDAPRKCDLCEEYLGFRLKFF
jgi:hypothetical protein